LEWGWTREGFGKIRMGEKASVGLGRSLPDAW